VSDEVDSIRRAIAAGLYEDALAGWNVYSARLRRALQCGTLTAAEMQEVRALFEWARPVLLGARAHMRDRYHELEVAAAYGRRPGEAESLRAHRQAVRV
jgi:hypothetical protein